jgi:predicted transcriptional regulator
VDASAVIATLDDWLADSEARRLVTTDAAERLYG